MSERINDMTGAGKSEYLPIPGEVGEGVDEKFTHVAIALSPQMSAHLETKFSSSNRRSWYHR